MKFRKKPVVIEAIQFTGSTANIAEISAFVTQRELRHDPANETLIIETLEGDHTASLGDWIIKGVKDECYPCRSDIFELTYEPV